MRLALATIASAVTGVAIYWIVVRLGMPALTAQLTDAQVGWLREAFRSRPGLVLTAIVVVVAVLALPVPLVFRVVAGPLRLRAARRPDA
jgi:hypothetical protein